MTGYNYKWDAEYQKEKTLRNLLIFIKKNVAKFSPYYKELFSTKELEYSKFRNLEDFRTIPLTTKEDHLAQPLKFILNPHMPEWWECVYQTEPLSNWQTFKYWIKSINKLYFREIFGKEVMHEDERVLAEATDEWLPVHFHNTSRSKNPLLIAYTRRDLQRNVPEIAAHLYLTGFKANWEVFNFIPASPTIGFFQSVWTPLTVGGGTFFTCGEEVTSLETQIELANKITFEVFLGSPSYISYWLAKALEELNKNKINPIKNVKKCILVGEPLSIEQKQNIKIQFEQLGSDVEIIESYNNNRMKVSFIECSENSGIHLNPRYFFWEVLNQKTLEPVEDGKEGYLCFSHIDWRGSVFLRYNTGDLIKGLKWHTCEKCGLTMPIIQTPIIRAADDFIKLKNKKFSKFALENNLKMIKGITAFQAILSTTKIELFVNIDSKNLITVEKEITEKIQDLTGIAPEIIRESKEQIYERLFSRGILKAEFVIVK